MGTKKGLKARCLSLYVIILSWRIENNRRRMGRMLDQGAPYTAQRLSDLDDENKRLGQDLHRALSLLLKRNKKRQEKEISISEAA